MRKLQASWIVLASVVVIAAAVGCGSDGRSPPNINVNKDNVCEQVAAVACHNLYSCCTEGEIENYLNVDEPRTEIECRRDVEKVCGRNLARYANSIANGRAHFDDEVMTGCLEALITPDDCTIVGTDVPWGDACEDSAWTGAVADGGECLEPFECTPGESFCAGNRTCTPLPRDGQPCGVAGCVTGLACITGTCRPLLGQGGVCTSTIQCADGLYCDTTTATRTCQLLQPVGASCTTNAACDSGQCLPGTCSITQQNCYRNADCGGRCADDLGFCLADGDCGLGTCSIAGTTCATTANCPVGEVCNLPVTCMLQTCLGDVVCADRYIVTDYCQAVGNLPIP